MKRCQVEIVYGGMRDLKTWERLGNLKLKTVCLVHSTFIINDPKSQLRLVGSAQLAA